MNITMRCISAQRTATAGGALGGARVVLVETSPAEQNKGARLEVFLPPDLAEHIQQGDVRTVTIT